MNTPAKVSFGCFLGAIAVAVVVLWGNLNLNLYTRFVVGPAVIAVMWAAGGVMAAVAFRRALRMHSSLGPPVVATVLFVIGTVGLIAIW